MFRLLSKESNIFSIPVYIFFLFLLIISFNILDFKTLGVFSSIITFCGFALGYFLFNAIGLNYNTHLPLFLYTFFVFALYPGSLDIGIAMSLFTNSFVMVLLTSNQDEVRKNSYLIIGAILAVNFLFLPTTWPMFIFVLIHLISTSDHISLNIFRLFFGNTLVFGTYFGVMYLIGYHDFDESYIPYVEDSFLQDYYPLHLLLPVALYVLYAVMDHFANFNKKSPSSKFKYTFMLMFFFAQLVTVFLYMGKNYEYLLLLVLPNVIILSRALRFLKKYWMKEFGLWIIILTLLLFKLSTYVNIGELI
ncbi:DUF6427 family protein [Cloacibacterium normanense]|uniref:Putative membrane protein n=1 Tax=Cloacibacterium normanense TaxID=237258 RepID=A0A1E5UEA4_9FLAO|nr:DUF6427 family protein [Cloacibacterium normanense]AZI69986.1 hypothetical protein EB819_08920 [Cloacibacterium normanense]OEL11212.1 putative membrane protein [Cloacibacterium normanense]